MTKKVNGGTATGKVVKSKALVAREAKELSSMARFQASVENALNKPKAKVEPKTWAETKAKAVEMSLKTKPMANGKAKPKAKVDRATERRSFIKQNTQTILKAWNALEEGKRSGAALNRVLPGMHNKWVDEVLMLNGLRQSGEEVVIKAVNEDKAFLKDVVVARKAEPKAKVNNNLKAPVVKNGGYTDEG